MLLILHDFFSPCVKSEQRDVHISLSDLTKSPVGWLLAFYFDTLKIFFFLLSTVDILLPFRIVQPLRPSGSRLISAEVNPFQIKFHERIRHYCPVRSEVSGLHHSSGDNAQQRFRWHAWLSWLMVPFTCPSAEVHLAKVCAEKAGIGNSNLWPQ